MNENKKMKVWLALLSCLLILLGAYVFYLEYNRNNVSAKTEEKENMKDENNATNNKDSEKQSLTYSNVAGYYTDSYKGVFYEEEAYLTTKLSLWEDGTFSIEQCYDVPWGYIGNYIIDGDKIILNILIETGSSTDLAWAKGKIELNIEENGFSFNEVNTSSLKLFKASVKREENSTELTSNVNDTLKYYFDDSIIY